LEEITATAAAGAAGVTKMPALCFLLSPVAVSLTQPFASYLQTGSRRTLSRYLWLESRLKAFLLLFLLPISQVKRTHTQQKPPRKTSYISILVL
jgi:hypothetical protein